MTDHPLTPLTGRFWRMLGIRWQHRPFESGAHLTGGRWNPPGMPALYLSADTGTAIMEMHQDLVRLGTLVGFDVAADAVADLTAFDVAADAVADLTAFDPAVTACLWRRIAMIDRAVPPSWPLATRLVAAGAAGHWSPRSRTRAAPTSSCGAGTPATEGMTRAAMKGAPA